MVISHNFYMGLALSEAWKYQILTYPNPAVGATLISPCGKILAVEAHQKAGLPHAEVLALKQGYFQLTQDEEILPLTASADIHDYLIKHHNGVFHGCEIYTTLEPCAHVGKTPSCAMLISEVGISKVYIGSMDRNATASGGAKLLEAKNIAVEQGVLEEKCEALLFPFYRYLKGQFVFFKWAQRLDGSTNDGVISSASSRELVHKMRDVCDLLVIGGNTVRTDRPTLDARLCDGKAPDVLIYSKQKEFDTTIPLFGIEGRKVFVSDDLSIMQEYKCIMIEGTQTLFEATRDIVDIYLAFVAPKMAKSDGFRKTQAQFDILHSQKIDNDILLYMREKDGR